MSTWARSLKATTCPGCGKHVAAGAPVRLLEIKNVKRKPWRCQACAGVPVPPDLPATIEPGSVTKRMTPLRKLAFMTREDWRERAGLI